MQPKEFNLSRVVLILASTAVLVTFSYLFIDKPVAFWAVGHQLIPANVMLAITQAPKIFEVLAVFIFACALLVLALGLSNKNLNNLLMASIALVTTDFLVGWGKYAFGRYWPCTWYENNPSLITNNAYGFHFFHSKAEAFQSFPSGHTALTVTVMTLIALTYPRLRVPAIAVAVTIPLCLIGLAHHFVADTIGGAGLGWLVAYGVYHIKLQLEQA